MPPSKALLKQVRALVDRRKSIRLDLGCGPNKQPGCFGVDARALPGVDLVWDLEEFPWPLPDNCARAVFMSHFWEHISPKKTLPFMAELHRVCEPNAQVLIAAPYATEFRFVQDPTHINPTNEATFLYWDRADPSGLWEVYQPPVFHVDAFDILPAGRGRDFNAFLTCCKSEAEPCPRCAPQSVSLPGPPNPLAMNDPRNYPAPVAVIRRPRRVRKASRRAETATGGSARSARGAGAAGARTRTTGRASTRPGRRER